jgi:translation initiation factor IF-2
MSETKEPENKTAKAGRKTITLNVKRTVETGHVRQSFSHGRSKSVVVEKKRSKKPLSMQEATASVTQEQTPTAKPKRAQPPAKRSAAEGSAEKSRTVLRQLSTNEVDARARALIEARKRAEIEEKERAEEERRLAEEAALRAKEEALRAEEEARRKAEEAANAATATPSDEAADTAPQSAETEKTTTAKGKTRTADTAETSKAKKPTTTRAGAAKETASTTKAAPTSATTTPARPPRNRGGEEEASPARGRPDARAKKVKVATPVKKTEDERRGRGRLTITNALDEGQRERSLASLRRQRERLKKQAMGLAEPRKKIIRDVQLPEVITIQELANRMAERAVDVIKFLMKQGQMHKINDVIDADTAELIATEFGHNVKRVSEADVEEGFIGTEDDESDLQPRAPVSILSTARSRRSRPAQDSPRSRLSSGCSRAQIVILGSVWTT